MTADELSQLRREKDEFFKRSRQSPLSAQQQAAFDGLRYYPHNPTLDLIVTVVPFAEQDDLLIETTTGEKRVYVRYGEFRFTVEGVEARLTIYETDYGFFLPFVDANANRETYGAGRYLDPEPLPGGRFHIDFNLAYNPYCAYSPKWSCPLTPFENRLSVAIHAGELLPQGAWVE